MSRRLPENRLSIPILVVIVIVVSCDVLEYVRACVRCSDAVCVARTRYRRRVRARGRSVRARNRAHARTHARTRRACQQQRGECATRDTHSLAKELFC